MFKFFYKIEIKFTSLQDKGKYLLHKHTHKIKLQECTENLTILLLKSQMDSGKMVEFFSESKVNSLSISTKRKNLSSSLAA